MGPAREGILGVVTEVRLLVDENDHAVFEDVAFGLAPTEVSITAGRHIRESMTESLGDPDEVHR